MAVNDRNWLEMTGTGWKWQEMVLTFLMSMIMLKNGTGWPHNSFDCVLLLVSVLLTTTIAQVISTSSTEIFNQGPSIKNLGFDKWLWLRVGVQNL